MVNGQLRSRGIRDQRVLEAMAEIPRERFVGPTHQHEAYADHPVPIAAGQTISQPYVVALMTQELDVRSHHRVLDVGAGSGYQTAILARLAGEVFAIERIAELTRSASAVLATLGVDNVTLTTGDGTLGWPEHAPYDRILCGAAAPEVPPAWADQLAEGGRIVTPVGGHDWQMLVAVDKRGGKTTRRDLCGVRFVRLIGQQGWPDGQ
jgi:protein-L-isoaspartate(D-aspartate) O-methyltransferase